MLADPVTIAARSPVPSLVFAMTKSDGYGSIRIDTGGNLYTIKTVHQPNPKTGDRHYVQVTQQKDSVNPYTGLTQRVIASASCSILVPTFGFSSANIVDLYGTLDDYLRDSEVTIAKIILNQS